MSNKIKIPAIKLIPHNKKSYYYLSSDLQKLKSAYQSIINHYTNMCENENQRIVELPQYNYYMKTHSVAADIAYRLGSIYACGLEETDAEMVYDLMATKCIKAILYLNKNYNDIRLLKERTSKKYEEFHKEVYSEWLKYKSYLSPERRIQLSDEKFKEFLSKRPFEFDDNEFGYDNKEKDLNHKRRTFLWQDSTLRIQLIKAEYVILAYYRLITLIFTHKDTIKLTDDDKAFIKLVELAVKTANEEQDKILSGLGYIFDLCTIANIFMNIKLFDQADFNAIPLGHYYSQMVNFAHPEELGNFTFHIDDITSKFYSTRSDCEVEQLVDRTQFGNHFTRFPKISFNEFEKLEYEPHILFYDIYDVEELKIFSNEINLQILWNEELISKSTFEKDKLNFLLLCLRTQFKFEYRYCRTLNSVVVNYMKRDMLSNSEIYRFHNMKFLQFEGADDLYLVGRIEEGKGYQFIKKNNKEGGCCKPPSKTIKLLSSVNNQTPKTINNYHYHANKRIKNNYQIPHKPVNDYPEIIKQNIKPVINLKDFPPLKA